jgi:hypothetical protein
MHIEICVIRSVQLWVSSLDAAGSSAGLTVQHDYLTRIICILPCRGLQRCLRGRDVLGPTLRRVFSKAASLVVSPENYADKAAVLRTIFDRQIVPENSWHRYTNRALRARLVLL